jgi:putative tryptophan/tyrosine transport system substrate-binding protein
VNRNKTKLTTIGLVTIAALSLAGCGNSEPTKTPENENITIGITQIVEHPSLDDIREGFKEALLESEYAAQKTIKFDEQNAHGDQTNAITIAGKFASEKVNLVLAIATPTAQAAAQSLDTIPVIFSGVTAPLEAGLVESLEKPALNVTGTSDLAPIAEQIKLITEIVPNVKKIGIVSSSGEINSEVQVNLAKKAAQKLGIEIIVKPVTNTNEVATAAETLNNVDAIYIPTDNNVVASLEAVLGFAEKTSTPVFSADSESVERGAVATLGIDYKKLGYQTGKMAVRVLEGANPATMPVETISEVTLVVNPTAAKRQGITIPKSVLERADRIIKEY